jgi:hypothetical protein
LADDDEPVPTTGDGAGSLGLALGRSRKGAKGGRGKLAMGSPKKLALAMGSPKRRTRAPARRKAPSAKGGAARAKPKRGCRDAAGAED